MTKRNRVLATLFALAIVFVMFFSTAFIASEADHNCVGENCQICYQINECENSLKQLTTAVITVAVSIVLTYRSSDAILPLVVLHNPTTLITLRVKLSN